MTKKKTQRRAMPLEDGIRVSISSDGWVDFDDPHGGCGHGIEELRKVVKWADKLENKK